MSFPFLKCIQMVTGKDKIFLFFLKCIQMESTYTIVTVLSVIIFILSVYIYMLKKGNAEHFANRLYDDMGAGHDWDNTDYATVSGL
jgi:hypothetical protein